MNRKMSNKKGEKNIQQENKNKHEEAKNVPYEVEFGFKLRHVWPRRDKKDGYKVEALCPEAKIKGTACEPGNQSEETHTEPKISM